MFTSHHHLHLLNFSLPIKRISDRGYKIGPWMYNRQPTPPDPRQGRTKELFEVPETDFEAKESRELTYLKAIRIGRKQKAGATGERLHHVCRTRVLGISRGRGKGRKIDKYPTANETRRARHMCRRGVGRPVGLLMRGEF